MSTAWEIVEASGVAWGEVDERPDGKVIVRAGEHKVTFGPDGEGWNWNAYEEEGAGYGWISVNGGWTTDDSNMVMVLKQFLA